MLKVKDLLAWGRQELSALGDRQATVDTELLIEHLLACRRSELYQRSESEISDTQREQFEAWLAQRKKRVPLGYILGRAYFWHESLEIGPGCLVPRPETEILVESLMRQAAWKKEAAFELLDMGTGSGAIAIALLREFPNSRATLADRSAEALKFARRNIQRYGLESRAETVLSDLWMGFSSQCDRRWDVIVSNPPYLSAADLAQIEPELAHEPREALDGGQDGYDFYRTMIAEAPRWLSSRGWLAFEVGIGQSGCVSRMIEAKGLFQKADVIQDHAGIDRVVIAQRK